MSSITEEDYIQTQQQIVLLAWMVKDMPLDAFLAAISLADSVGPLVDPTLYREAHLKMDAVREAAEALRGFQRVAAKQFAQQGAE